MTTTSKHFICLNKPIQDLCRLFGDLVLVPSFSIALLIFIDRLSNWKQNVSIFKTKLIKKIKSKMADLIS